LYAVPFSLLSDESFDPSVTAEPLLFYFLAAFAVTTAVLMIIQRNPLMSALFLIANFFCLAALYLLLRAQFLAVLEVIVYAGAIMVLVVFVIMLLNLVDDEQVTERLNLRKIIGIVLVFGLTLELGFIFAQPKSVVAASGVIDQAGTIGTVESMGATLYGKFLFPFEMTSFLLLAAIIGAVVLAKKRTQNA
jgi:NADH-quinone oxidoreductase subunit J